MTISLRADSGGTSGAIQVAGADKLLINSNGSMTTPAVTSAFKNLRIITTGSSTDVTITADELVVSNGSGAYKTLSAVSAYAMTNASGAYGLDTGSLAANTWYALWVIWNGSTVAGLLSLSSTSPTLPSGYGFKARVGWIRTDNSVNKLPYAMLQVGASARWRVGVGNTPTFPTISSGIQGNISGGAPTFVQVSLASAAPPTAYKVTVMGWSSVSAPSTQLVAATSTYGGYGSSYRSPELVATGNPTASGAGLYSQATIVIWDNYLYVASDNANCGASVIGWEDAL